MTIEQYNRARHIREHIDHMKVKKIQLEKMKRRDDDPEFSTVIELAFDGLCYSITRLEEDFKAI